MQALRTAVGDIITLDMRKITSKGITVGSSFYVPELAHASCRFGSTSADAHVTQVNMAQHQVKHALFLLMITRRCSTSLRRSMHQLAYSAATLPLCSYKSTFAMNAFTVHEPALQT